MKNLKNKIIKNKNLRDLAFLSFIILGAVLLRTIHLGMFGFWWDELYHVLAAQSINKIGHPFIPLQGDYTRALPFTYIISIFFKLFGTSEVSARLPSVIFNITFIILSFFIIRKWFNRSIAFLFIIVISFSPFTIVLARECRMYTLFQLLYFLGAYFFFLGFENNNHRLQLFKKIESEYKINIFYLVISSVLLIIASRIHALTYNFGIVVIGYSFFLFLYTWKNKGLFKSINSKYFFTVILSAFSILIILIIDKTFIMGMIRTAQDIPVWTSYKVSNFNYYRYFLSESYPVIFFIYPLSICLMIKEDGKKGFFVFSSFIFLIILHIFVFKRQWERYIFYIFPFFVLGGVYLIDKIIKYVWEYTSSNFSGVPVFMKFILIIASLSAFNSFAYPWMGNSKNVYKSSKFSRWENIPQKIIDEVKQGKIITTRQMAYIDKFKDMPDYFMRSIPVLKYVHDDKYNIQVINNFNKLEKIFIKESEPLYVVVTPWTLNNNTITTKKMRNYILSNCSRFYVGTRREIIIFKRLPTS